MATPLAILAAAFLGGSPADLPHDPPAAVAERSGPGLFGPPADTATLASEADAILSPPGGPRLVSVHLPASELVAVRVSIPLREEEGEAGAAEVIRRMALARAEDRAARVGARLEGARTPWGLAYTVSGSARELDHLVGILHQLMEPPEPERMGSAVDDVLLELEEVQETPGGVLAARLRSGALPGDVSPETVRGVLERMDFDVLRAIWERSHRRDRLGVVGVGPVPAEVFLASVGDLGTRDGTLPDRRSPSSAPPPPPDDPEVIRHWRGVAFGVDGADPRAAVTAALLSQRFRERPGPYDIGVELVEDGDRAALVVWGAAYPGEQGALRERLDGLWEELAEHLSDRTVREAAGALERELVTLIRTPWGLANLVGRELDRGADPPEPDRYLETLRAVDEGAMRAFLQAVDASTRVEEALTP